MVLLAASGCTASIPRLDLSYRFVETLGDGDGGLAPTEEGELVVTVKNVDDFPAEDLEIRTLLLSKSLYHKGSAPIPRLSPGSAAQVSVKVGGAFDWDGKPDAAQVFYRPERANPPLSAEAPTVPLKFEIDRRDSHTVGADRQFLIPVGKGTRLASRASPGVVTFVVDDAPLRCGPRKEALLFGRMRRRGAAFHASVECNDHHLIFIPRGFSEWVWEGGIGGNRWVEDGHLVWVGKEYVRFAPRERTEPAVTANPPSAPGSSAGGSGYLKLSSNVPGVEVFLDGKALVSIEKPGTAEGVIKKVAPGSYLVEARKEFYKRISLKISVQQDGVVKHHFVMERAAGFDETATTTTRTQQARGALTLLTERKGVVVVLDGQNVDAPTELKDVPAGEYTMTVKVNGSEERKVQVTIRDGQKAVVDLDKK
jgi:hypothetical protein